jgi:hypothetical protein
MHCLLQLGRGSPCHIRIDSMIYLFAGMFANNGSGTLYDDQQWSQTGETLDLNDVSQGWSSMHAMASPPPLGINVSHYKGNIYCFGTHSI